MPGMDKGQMEMEKVLRTVLTASCYRRFYRFANADGKVWIMPARHMRLAMQLYQPGGRNGKLLKALLPWLHRFRPLRRWLHMETMCCDLTEDLKRKCCEWFQVPEIEFAIFCGTPSVHRKLTMQLSCRGRIVGYVKMTDCEEIARLFRDEATLLDDLKRRRMDGIPACLYCGAWKDITLFVQDTVKTPASRLLHQWTPLQEDFLDRLYQATHRMVVFEQTDYYAALTALKKHIEWLPAEVDASCVAETVDRVLADRSGKKVDFSAYHADFTPWNMFVEKGRLFVFDWEYARATYPPGLDRYHFFVQSAIFEKHWGTEEILRRMREEKMMTNEGCMLYLLEVIARFTMRERGNVTGDIARSMQIWVELLKKVCV